MKPDNPFDPAFLKAVAEVGKKNLEQVAKLPDGKFKTMATIDTEKILKALAALTADPAIGDPDYYKDKEGE